MFGGEKEKKGSALVFDLEKDLQDEKRQKELVTYVEKHVQEIKMELRKGTKAEDFGNLGVLLHGYSALLKILTQPSKKHS